MNFRKKDIYFYSKFLSIGIFLCCILACKKASEAQIPEPKSESKNVLNWIDSARNSNNTFKIRKENLEKAYFATNAIKQDSTRLKLFSKIQWSYLDLNDSLNFRQTNEKTRKLAIKLGDSTRLAATHWDLAVFFDRESLKDSAFFHYAKGQKIFEAIGKTFEAGKMFYNMAVVQSDVKDYAGSEVNTIKAIELLKPLNENLELYHCYNTLGVIAKDLKDYKRALEHYDIANGYLKKLKGGHILQPGLNNNIGVVYQEMGDHDRAITYFEKIVSKDSLMLKKPRLYARALNNIADSKFKIKANDQVENLLLNGLKIRDSVGDIAGMAGSYLSLAEYHLGKGDSINALVSATKAKQFSQESSNNERLLQSLALLSELDQQNASVHARDYYNLSESLQQEERRLRDKFARIRFETNETKAENVLLARQKQLWTGIAVTLLLLALASYLFFDQRAKNQKLRFQREQQASNEKIFNLLLSESRKVEEAKKMEQKRISEELHDGVQGRIQGARMVLLGLNKRTTPEAISERAEAIKELMDIQEEVRAISHELSHSAYQKIHNFISSITDLLKGIEASAGLQHSFEYDEKTDWDGLSGDIKINLYRMIQESLQNAVKHAQAKSVSLRFEVDKDNMLTVSISDDGKGFAVKRGKKGIGLRNIESRAEKLNASWDIESAIGKGTTVTLNIPIRKYDSQEREKGETTTETLLHEA